MRDFDQIIQILVLRTQHVFAIAQGAKRHQRLSARVEQLHGALELARLYDHWHVALRIETHIQSVRRDIEADSAVSRPGTFTMTEGKLRWLNELARRLPEDQEREIAEILDLARFALVIGAHSTFLITDLDDALRDLPMITAAAPT